MPGKKQGLNEQILVFKYNYFQISAIIKEHSMKKKPISPKIDKIAQKPNKVSKIYVKCYQFFYDVWRDQLRGDVNFFLIY